MKTAVITGASYGIGESIAKNLLQKGWKVYGVSRSKPAFEDERFVWLKCDLAKSDLISESLSAISEPSIDVLVSNAGTITIEQASEVTQESYEQTYSVNVLAPMLIVKALRDKITSAVIISMSSVADRIPGADVALYCSSKAANTVYFDSLADELKDARIHVVLPDYVDTPMQHRTQDDNPDFDWKATIAAQDVADFTVGLIEGSYGIESGSNVIIVNEALKEDLISVEKLYGFNVDTSKLAKM